MKKYPFLFFVMLHLVSNSFGQSTNFKYYNLSNAFKNSVYYIRCLSDSAYKGANDSIKLFANARLRDTLPGLLRVEATFDDPFDSLTTISVIKSSDEKLRVFTWFVPLNSNRQYLYEGVMQYRDTRDKIFKVSSLTDSTCADDLMIKKVCKKDNWYGALYYNVIGVRKNGNMLYTLIGWKGYSEKVTKKVVDVVKFTKGEPSFGSAIFQNVKKMQSRLIFSYSSSVSMKLNYDEKQNMIVFEHLSAPDGTENAAPEVMGPDMTYDGLKWRDEKWQYQKDVKVKNPFTEKDKQKVPPKQQKKLYTPAIDEGEKK